MFIANVIPTTTLSESNPLFFRETLQQLALEHMECAIFYLTQSICSKSNPHFSDQFSSEFELMMRRAYQLAAEAGVKRAAVSARGKQILDGMNGQIGGDCNKVTDLAIKYENCKALEEDLTSRGSKIMQERLRAHD